MQRKKERKTNSSIQPPMSENQRSKRNPLVVKERSSRRGVQRNAEGSKDWLTSLPVVVGHEYEVEIVGIGHTGEGVGRFNDYTLFVSGVLPGELALVRVEHVKKQYGYAKLVRLIRSSTDRVAAPCSIYEQCGGCQLQHLSYDAQLKVKRQIVVDNLERIAKLHVSKENDPAVGLVVHDTLGMDEPWRYRNKVQVPIGEVEGGLVGGFYAQGTHRIINMESCLIQHDEGDRIVETIKQIGGQLGISAYNEANGTGLLRHVVVKVGFQTKEIMIVLVTNGAELPHEEEWVNRIREAIPEVASICQNINVQKTNVIFGDRTIVLWGREVIYDYIGDLRFAISPRSFFQVNPVQTEVLYEKTLEYAALTGQETVIDAYCGIGTISLFLAKKSKRVYGVEIVPEAIEDAQINADLNGIVNVEFAVGRAEEVLPQWQRNGVIPDVVVVDPPRKGCEVSLLETLIELQPKKIVYVSCNPSTLARDLRILEDGGYRTAEVQPVDMFPHTVHVECCVSLVRN
ncbi:23S rRNA (uracil(1939)-C(5))-methyltransferase RlmD [Paenibacillus sp. NPDC056579]|uniref:23S rRNA (uracil(1939)-C(5))-methyltransferase RlmD n=1 Tax=Paenibacillus sp. NPDC056579 TaxID=3345871 RepID=UPI00367B2C7C